MTSARLATAALAAAALVAAGCSTSGTDDSAASTTTNTPAPAQQWEPTSDPTTVSPPPSVPPRAIPPTDEPADVADVDRSDAHDVAGALLETWYGWRPLTDDGPNDAAARAAALMTDDFRERSFSTAPIRGAGGDFARWQQEDVDHVAVEATYGGMEGAHASDTAEPMVFNVIQTAHAGDREVGTAEHIVYVLAIDTGDGWAIDELSVR